MRRIILLRHGLTAWNAERRFQGQADTELNETGVLQAKTVAGALAAYSPALVWSSDLARARVTAMYVAEQSGVDLVVDQRLREVHVGELSGLTHEDVRDRFGPGPWDYAAHGGESDQAVAQRIAVVIEAAAEATVDGQTAVLVSHGAAIRTGVLRFLGWPAEQVRSLGPLDNCGWVELSDTPATGARTPAWRLAAYNRVAGDFPKPGPLG